MTHVNYTEFRRSLASHMDTVCDNREPLVVTRQGGRSVVVIAEDEFDGIMETLHLLRTPANAAFLARSIEDAGAGRLVERDLIDPERPAS